MNTRCPTTPFSATIAPVKTPAARGLLASLQALINQPGLTSVDLVDTIFATLPRGDGAPYEAVVRTEVCFQNDGTGRQGMSRSRGLNLG